jgi:hypothetical protein
MQSGGGIDGTDNQRQSMTRTGALDVEDRQHTLYRPDLGGPWKQSGLDRMARSVALAFFVLGFRVSRPLIQAMYYILAAQ